MEATLSERLGGDGEIPSQRILIADDAMSSRDLLRSILASSGHEVQEATDGVEVLETMTIFRPALIILDMDLPGMDGFNTARRVRRVPGFERVPLVLLVPAPAYSSPEEIAAAGFSACLVKPIGPRRLRECVGGLLEAPARSTVHVV